MTILFINSTRKWGGVKTWTLDFGRSLKERGHSIVSIVRPRTPFVEACTAEGFKTYPVEFGPKYNPVAIFRVIRIIKRERPDVAVVNISKDLNVGATAAKLCKIPVLHRVGLVEDFKGTFEEKLINRFLVDAILTPAETMKTGLVEKFPWISGDRIHAIPNSKLASPNSNAPATRSGPAVIGTTSQLSQSKGHTYLFQALEQIKNKGLNFKLRIANKGALEEQLRREAVDRGLSEETEFCGFQKNIKDFLRGLDVFVLPSLKEGFPNTLLEAMAEGLPVVAFDLPGAVEMVQDDGILAPVRDVAALAEGIGKLLADPELRMKLGWAARERVERCYDVSKNALRLEKLLMTLAAK